MPDPDVSVVVPSHGSARTLPRLLEALRSQTLDRARFEVLVVDPAFDGTVKLIERARRDWDGGALRHVRGPVKDGPAAKRNAGARAARGALLAFTDADCVPDPDWLEAGLRAARDGAEIVQGQTRPPDGDEPNRFGHMIFVTSDNGLHETCNIFYRRDLFVCLGGFSTHYFRRYSVPFGEDAELGWRARRAGARYRFEPSAVVRHPVGTTDLRGHLREQWLGRGFPLLARDVPELRRALFYQRLFLSRRSALFACATVGAALAPRLPPVALLALPYARELRRSGVVGRNPRRLARALTANLASDAVLAAGLWYGSLRARAPVI